MKKEIITLLLVFLLGVASLLMCIGCALRTTEIYGEDYTEIYTIYKDLSYLDSLEEVEEYLVSNNYSYKIKEGTLTLDDYNEIKFIISNDNTYGYLAPCNEYEMLAKLDQKDYETVTIENFVTDDGERIELIYLKHHGDIYSKIGNNYYINFTIKYKLISSLSGIVATCSLVYSIGCFLADLYNFKKSKKKQQN